MKTHGVEVEFEQATEAHAAELARTMRPECVADLASLGVEPGETLARGLKVSDAWTITFNGAVAAMFGVSGASGFWVLTSPLVAKHPRAFLVASRAAADLLLEDRECLENWVAADFPATVRWLRWLGADIGGPVPRGPYSRLYLKATLRREVVNVRRQ